MAEDWNQETDANGNPSDLRVRRATPKTVSVPSGVVTRIDTAPLAGRKSVHFQNMSAGDVRYALAGAAPAAADTGLLTVGDYRTFLAGEAVGAYIYHTQGAPADVFLQEVAT